MSNVMGYLTPIKEMVKLAQLHGAYTILDAAQSILHTKVDVDDLNIDALAFVDMGKL